MAAPRASWKGFLRIAEVTCPVALHAAASTSDRIAFHTLNRANGHRVNRRFIDGQTGAPVETGDQVKGYEIGKDDYVVLEPQDIAAAVPQSDKTLTVPAFIGCAEVDDVFFDRPYYLTPADKGAAEAYSVIRDGMRRKNVVALARTVLFRRVRTVLVRAHHAGMIATTLNFDHEVRAAAEVFGDVPSITVEGEMLELAQHIIRTKTGAFDPAAFDDRYENALAGLVKVKSEGRRIAPPKAAADAEVVDLMAALRESAGLAGKKPARRSAPRKADGAGRRAATGRKAG